MRRKKKVWTSICWTLELAGGDALVDPLVRGIEAPRVAGHGHQPGPLGDVRQPLGVGQAVGHRNLDLHMLAGLKALDRLGRMHLGRRGQDRGLVAGVGLGFGQVERPVRDVEPFGDRARAVLAAPGQAHHLDAGDVRHRLDVLNPERTLTGHGHLHGRAP